MIRRRLSCEPMVSARLLAITLVPLVVLATVAMAVAGSGSRVLAAPSDSLVEPGAKLEQISTGHRFTEGPAVAADGSLYFSDVQSSTIHKRSTSGHVGVHRSDTERSNGLYFDADGNLVVCVMGGHRVERDDMKGGVTTVVDTFNGQPLVAPNDLWIHPNGGIYFTDPDFAGTAQSSVFYLPPDNGRLRRVVTSLSLPNGVIGTPDGKSLYIADYAGHVWRYGVDTDGSLTNRAMITTYPGDGMTLDERGNLYVASDKVYVFAPDGSELESIIVPETPSNLTFGGPDGKTLFITAVTSVYSLQMVVRGAYAPEWEPTSTPTVTAGTPTHATPGTPTTTYTYTPEVTLTPTEDTLTGTVFLPRVLKGSADA